MKAARRTAGSFLLPLPAGLALTGLLLTGCTTGSAASTGTPRPPAPSATAPGATTPSGDPTDAAWVQLMTPMNERVVDLLSLAVEKAADPELRSWAARLRTARTTELTRLRTLLARMGLPGTDVHEGHNMPGMVTADDLAQARAADGAEFDRFLVTRVRDHLRRSAQVSRSEVAAGSRAGATELASAFVIAREGELAALDKLSARLPDGAG